MGRILTGAQHASVHGESAQAEKAAHGGATACHGEDDCGEQAEASRNNGEETEHEKAASCCGDHHQPQEDSDNGEA